jgi:NET1-associated nuclear protein 1 (U3 small nucleolar RNA-associated protein 17)
MHAHGISCFARSTPHPHHLYVGTVYGKLYRFEWTTGERQGIVEASRGGCIRGLTTVQLPNTDEEAVFTTEMAPRSSKRQREVEKNADENFIHTLVFRKAPWDESEDARQVLHKSDRSLRHLKVLDGGRMIFVASENQLLIGTLPGTVGVSTTSFKKLTSEYRWRHLDSNHAISCFDVYPQLVSPQGKPGKSRQRKQYDLALGNAKGELLIFENVVQQLEMIENQGSNKPARARMLRWHREAPNTVKWSKDGTRARDSHVQEANYMHSQLPTFWW